MYEAKDLVDLLITLEPGKLPLEVFNQIARLTVIPVVEVVAFYREEDGDLKVFLLKRSSDDPFWPDKYHVPGTIINGTDQPGSFSDALHRIKTTKLDPYEPSDIAFVNTQLCKVKRGMELTVIYVCELKSRPPQSSLFNPIMLPDNIVECQASFIDIALKFFDQKKT